MTFRATRTLFLLLALAVTSTVGAAEQPHRIGYVNSPWVLENSPQAKAVEAKLKESFQQRQDDVRKREVELEKLEQRLTSGNPKLQGLERKQLERKMLSDKRRLKIAWQEFEEDLAFRKNDEINKLRRVIKEVVQSVAQERSIDLVFETAVVYVSDRVDISRDVLSRLEALAENEAPAGK